jgi:hypothetical protein
MSKESKNKNSSESAPAAGVRYAVLTKRGRIQILMKPSPRQLRKRGTRGWDHLGSVEEQPNAGQILTDLLNQAIREVEGTLPAEVDNGKKPKRSKADKE